MMKPNFSLALVTGASSGIGEALCRLLAQKGVPLLMVARDKARLDNLAEELRTEVPVIVIPADLGSEQGCKVIVEAMKQYVPDLIVNNAGFGLYGPAIDYETKENLDMIDLNIKALLDLTLEGTKLLISKRKEGTILNISSASDFIVFPGFAVYAATKAFVTQFSRSLDVETSPKGVRVLVSCPGVVRTEFRKRAAGKRDAVSGSDGMDVDFAARELWNQIIKGRGLNYFDFKTRFMVSLARFILPQKLVSKILFKKVSSYKNK